MACKRKLDFSDVGSAEEANSASIHGVVTFLSPMKASVSGTEFFNGLLSDGKATLKVVGFKEADQEKIKHLMEAKEPMTAKSRRQREEVFSQL